jgi:hypothetical protein
MKTRTRRVLVWINDGFDGLDVATWCQVLSLAGSTWNWRAYRIVVASLEGGKVQSNAQFALDSVRLKDALASASTSSTDHPEAEKLASLESAKAPPFDVVILAGSEHNFDFDLASLDELVDVHTEWVGLRSGIVPLLGRFPDATVAASPALQARLRAHAPVCFTSGPWHQHGNLWSTSAGACTDAALAFVQHHLGKSARRSVEAALGLTTSLSPIRIVLPSQSESSEPEGR